MHLLDAWGQLLSTRKPIRLRWSDRAAHDILAGEISAGLIFRGGVGMGRILWCALSLLACEAERRRWETRRRVGGGVGGGVAWHTHCLLCFFVSTICEACFARVGLSPTQICTHVLGGEPLTIDTWNQRWIVFVVCFRGIYRGGGGVPRFFLFSCVVDRCF